MKIVVISDTHGITFADMIPECDLLIHCGDISPVRLDHGFYIQKQWFIDSFIPELKRIPAKNIVFIGGNHDTFLSESNNDPNGVDFIKSLLPPNVKYISDELVEIDGIRIYGSSWVNLPPWARAGAPVWNFAAIEDDLDDIYAGIPDDIDILVSHGPAHGCTDIILDKHVQDIFDDGPKHIGSTALAARLSQIKCKLVVHGHIHSANHEYETKNNVKYVCTSVLNEQYTVGYKPLVVDWNEFIEE